MWEKLSIESHSYKLYLLIIMKSMMIRCGGMRPYSQTTRASHKNVSSARPKRPFVQGEVFFSLVSSPSLRRRDGRRHILVTARAVLTDYYEARSEGRVGHLLENASRGNFLCVSNLSILDCTSPRQVLGVSATSSDREIKAAYRKKAKELHPDVNKAPGAEEQFMKCKEAYQAREPTVYFCNIPLMKHARQYT